MANISRKTTARKMTKYPALKEYTLGDGIVLEHFQTGENRFRWRAIDKRDPEQPVCIGISPRYWKTLHECKSAGEWIYTIGYAKSQAELEVERLKKIADAVQSSYTEAAQNNHNLISENAALKSRERALRIIIACATLAIASLGIFVLI